jgi:hypothetical protein
MTNVHDVTLKVGPYAGKQVSVSFEPRGMAYDSYRRLPGGHDPGTWYWAGRDRLCTEHNRGRCLG